MIVKSREIEIPKENPFANDVLEREESAEILTQFVTSSRDPMVICIDASWGQGKTTFLRMWGQHLKNNNIPTLYFNAWESDFSDDALVCLIGEISASVEELSKANKSKARKYLNEVKNIGASLIKRSIPVATKVITGGVLSVDDFSEKALSSFTESFAKEQIEKYQSSKKSLQSFRGNLSAFAKSISDSADPKPLVFIIDELDRCRPNFAIEILEKAKHFFNVDNIVFVLGADKEQLGSSIKVVYGEGLYVNGYLRRFIDFDYLFPQPAKELFMRALFNKFSFNKCLSRKEGDLRYERDHALSMFSSLVELYKLTLREQEHCCSLLSLSIRTTPESEPLHPLFLCFLIALKVKDSEVYKKFIKDVMTSDELWDYFKKIQNTTDFILSDYGMVLEAYVTLSKVDPRRYMERFSYYQRELKKIGKEGPNRSRAYKPVQLLEKLLQSQEKQTILKGLVNKIEIASRFAE